MPKYLVDVQRFTPLDDDELWDYVHGIFDIQIPRVRVCSHHQSPFDAFADAYFARHSMSVWKASRGLGGKSFLLAVLSLTEMVSLGATVTILGGSGQQSLRVHDAMTHAWSAPYAPTNLLRDEPTRYTTKLTNGAEATVLTASQTSVRGPHPNRLRLDEVDEMTLDIFDAALGQPMSSEGVPSQVVMSSTHHLANGTMTEIYRRARDNDSYKCWTWCYRETMQGWLSAEEVERVKDRVTALMWQVEYEGQEPAGGAVAILPEAVEFAFDPDYGEFSGAHGEYIEIERPRFDPDAHAPYAHGTDWAKEVDWTILVTYRTDVYPWRLVAWQRLGREPWPSMVAAQDERLARYGGVCCHDNTGLGDVVDDYIQHSSQVHGVQLVGKKRQDIFTEYIAALENKDMRGPRITWAYDEHRYVSHGDLTGAGHPPDSFVAGALAWHARQYNVGGDWGFI